MSFTKYFRRNAYRWHRISSLIVAIPVLLWTISGLLHPVMNSAKPKLRNQSVPAAVLDTTRITLPLAAALLQNSIDRITHFRIVKLYEVFYYQVRQPGVDTLTYINCTSGTVLLHGDRNYAAYLAQRFLSEALQKQDLQGGHQHGSDAGFLQASFTSETRSLPEKARVKSVQLITRFDQDYKASNKLLPVYRVAFDRADSIRIYVETPADRLALAVDSRKSWFTRFFAATHSWSFLDGLGKGKTVLLGSFSLLCFASGILGFYVYRITNKKSGKKRMAFSKRLHRLLGNVFLTTTLLFAFSGAWHSFQKLVPKPEPKQSIENVSFASQDLNLDLKQIANQLQQGEKLNDVSVVQFDEKDCWQLTISKDGKKEKRYLHTQTLQPLAGGDLRYAAYLACKYANRSPADITNTRIRTSFDHHYSMMNKRLPVVEVAFAGNESYFVETATCQLAAVANEASSAERFSFSNLHMHHFWESWLGRETGSTIRNWVLVATTSGMLLAALTGMLIYMRRKFTTR